MSALPFTSALERRLSGTPLVLFLDVDGTLAPIAPRPEEATVPAETKRILGDLVSIPSCHVVIVTGRAATDARRMVDLADLWLIGNHGIEVAPPNAAPAVREDIAVYERVIQTAIERASTATRDVPGVLVENKKWSMTVHFRLADSNVESELERTVAAIGRELGLRMLYGKKVFELRPPFDIDKGTATLTLARQLGALNDGASLLCAGDDRTDEDAFRALRAVNPQSVTVRVGNEVQTAAEFTLPDPGAMRELLDRILTLRRRGSAAA